MSVPLAGLQPATTYHYRFAAEDEREVEEGAKTLTRSFTVHGPDQTFATQPATLGFSLPDGRAWEMVSPPDKHGGRIAPPDPAVGGQFQAAANGEALAYLSYGSLEAAPEGNRAIEQSSDLSRRAAGGTWRTRDLTAPHTAVTSVSIGKGLEYKLFDPNLASALMEPRDTTLLSPFATERTPYLRDNAEPPTYTPLLSGAPGYADVPAGTEFGTSPLGGPKASYGAVKTQAATPDLRHVVLGSEVPIGAAPKGSLYEWSAEAAPEARLRIVSVLPGGEAVAAEVVSGRNAISEDGSRVFWTEENTGGGLGGGLGLYVRDSARGETARLDVEQAGAFGTGEEKPRFQGAAADGSVAFFTDTQNLTPDANEAGADLYRCAVVVEGGELKCDLTDLTTHLAGFGESAEALGVAAGGTWDYFVARGVLDTTPNREGEAASAGEPNLYLWRQGEGVRFIATGDSGGTASPSGRYLAFMSNRSLTGYDNRDAGSGERAQEAFLYDAAAEALTCLSCEPSGGRPRALRPGGGNLAQAVDPRGVWSGRLVAATLPESTKPSLAGNSLYAPRYLHDNGRVFFNAAGPLVGADSNGAWDVYEYEPDGLGSCSASAAGPATATLPGGCVSLISSGTAEGESAFIDASEGGRDAFFYTSARLSVTDVDQVTDVYDAREGGEPAVLSPPAECQGEACQPPASPPAAQTPASSTFRGPGDQRQGGKGARRCARPARQARRLSRRARKLRAAARRATAARPSARLGRKAARLAGRAKRQSRQASRCRARGGAHRSAHRHADRRSRR